MNKITYPLQFQPRLQENIWGGEYLKKRSTTAPTGAVGESWEISDYKDETTPILNGEYAGCSLHEVLPLITADEPATERFPLLLKILAPESKLSVQVHPTDDYTSEHSLNETGKAESWYILHAPENSFLYLGLKERFTPADLREAIQNHSFQDYLNRVYVKNGDVVNIPHGTIHSLCPGIRVFEVQQSSNITYRLYDWDRVDANGKSRQLHLAEALEVLNFDYLPESHLITPEIIHDKSYLKERYINNQLYTMEKISRMDSTITLDNSARTVYIISSINSELQIKTDGGSVVLKKYDSCLIPAFSGNISITGNYKSELLLFS